MIPSHCTSISSVQLTNRAIIQQILDSKVNDYVTLGLGKTDAITGRITYRSEAMIQAEMFMYYVMIDIKTLVAYFMPYQMYDQFGSDTIGKIK